MTLLRSIVLLSFLALATGCASSWAVYNEWFPEGTSTAQLVGKGVYIAEVDGAKVESGRKNNKQNGNAVVVRADRQLLRVRQVQEKASDYIWNFHFAPEPGRTYDLEPHPQLPGQLQITDRDTGEIAPVVID